MTEEVVDVDKLSDKELAELQVKIGKDIHEIAKEAEKPLSEIIEKMNKLLTPYGIEARYVLQLVETPRE